VAYESPASLTAGTLVTADKYNGLVSAAIPSTAHDEGGGDRTISSTTFATFTGAPSVAVTHGARVKVEWGAVVSVGASAGSSTDLSVDLSGSNTVAASSNYAAAHTHESEYVSVARSRVFTGLTAGTTTFALQAKRATSNGTVTNAWLIVTPVG
jgi:hypothetical protein